MTKASDSNHVSEGTSGDQLARMTLLGVFRLESTSGENVTPKGHFKTGLLALLATAPNGTLSRTKIRSLLWPAKESSAASVSLRNLLSVLKRDLAPVGRDVIFADDYQVTLDLAKFQIDVLSSDPNAGGAEFMDGLDLGTGEREEFEDWLRDERAKWAEKPSGDTEILQIVPKSSALSDNELLRGIMAETMPQTHEQRSFAIIFEETGPAKFDELSERLRAALVSVTGATIRNGRETHASGPLPVLGVSLDCARQTNGRVAAVATLRTLAQGEVIARQGFETDVPVAGASLGLDADAFVAQFADLSAMAIDKLPDKALTGKLVAFEAIHQMFLLKPESVARARDLINAGLATGRFKDFKSLSAYLETIRLGENTADGEPDDDQVSMALQAVDEVESGRATPLGATLAGYALDFIAADQQGAENLMTRAAVGNPTLAIAWDNLAMLLFRGGRFDEALACARRAIVLGNRSPLLHSFETSLCMIQMVRGNDREAAFYGLRALERNPRFHAALSYTAASLGHQRRTSEAQRILGMLKELDPGIDLEQVSERAILRFDPNAVQRLITGLRLAGLE